MGTSVYIPWSYKRHWNTTAKVIWKPKPCSPLTLNSYIRPGYLPPWSWCPGWPPRKLLPWGPCTDCSLSLTYSRPELKILVKRNLFRLFPKQCPDPLTVICHHLLTSFLLPFFLFNHPLDCTFFGLLYVALHQNASNMRARDLICFLCYSASNSS